MTSDYGQGIGPAFDFQQGQAPPAAPPRRKRRRVFLWIFLAIQLILIVWIIAGVAATRHTAPTDAQMAQNSSAHGPNSVLLLYKSRADCMAHYSRVLSDASGAGRGLGVAVVVVLWIVIDFLVGVPYAIYRLARRP
jgi:hypothetical protein